MRRISLLFFIFFILSCNTWSDNSFDEGTFISVGSISRNDLKIDNNTPYKTVKGNTLSLFYKIGKYDFGSFAIDGVAPGFILEKEIQGNVLKLKCVLEFPGTEIDNCQFTDFNIINLTIIDNEEIILNDLVFYDDEINKRFYRISGPSKIPIKNAVVNDNRVRLRVKPILTCETWAFLDKGLHVKIKDKSKKKVEIDGEKWYWYKVDNPEYPDGWVYGKYLDIEK